MKKTVWTFGLISGLICVIFLSTMTYFMSCGGASDHGIYSMLLGFAGMFLAMTLVFFGVRSFRDHYNEGVISFGKAFRLGLYIAFISSSMYVAGWLVINAFFYPEFMDEYTAHIASQVKSSGLPEAKIQEQLAELERNKESYKNPIVKILYTYAEILPVALIASLLSAAILKRKPKPTV